MYKKYFILIIVSFIFIQQSFNQDLKYARKIIRQLSSRAYFGRGYIKEGDHKAAHFISGQFKKIGLKPVLTDYFQSYNFDVNIFQGNPQVIIEDKKLIPGRDFTIRASSPPISGTFEIAKLDTNLFHSATSVELKKEMGNKLGYYDTTGWGSKWYRWFFRSNTEIPYKGTIQLINKTPGYGISTKQGNQASVIIKKDKFPDNAQKITLHISTKMINHSAYNVIGCLPGDMDSCILFTAHYDHIGGLGNRTFFPGANDNASGTAMVLDIAKELSKYDKHKYSFIFILFSGEEAGLLGSYYFTENPVIPLQKIKMVFNLDMVGTGSDGVSVYNGLNLKTEFNKLDSINKSVGIHLKLTPKNATRNNDIYPFYKAGVKGFTFLTDENNAPYHNINDKYKYLSFVSYEGLVKLMIHYIQTL